MKQELAIDDVEAVIADLETEYTTLAVFETSAHLPTATSRYDSGAVCSETA